ncbi:MAG: ATP-binding protein [Treponema sp.]|nr:ATP-binding protein [Treponema sp.]
MVRKLPIGIQDFEKLRTRNFVYVDKTAYVYKLAAEDNPYFLGRPRRFGKSLLLSTFKAYFEGKRTLFEATGDQRTAVTQPKLAIADLEKDWISYPVFHLDFNAEQYDVDIKGLMSGISSNLRPLEERWGKDISEDSPAARLKGLISRAYEKTGKKVVVLVDEYDKPLIQTMDNEKLQTEIRGVLKSFYGVLKAADAMLRFVFLTGVTKFSQVSIFSDLNQLRDISMDTAYAGVCGISASELTGAFKPELELLSEKINMTYEQTVEEMQKRYNGYHFAENSEGIFNPFSVLNTFANGKLQFYWFQTGTPTFLVETLKKNDFDLRELSEGISIPAVSINDYRAGGSNITPLLYQTGYLTIKSYDPELNWYTLGFPNEEVEYGFLNELLPLYAPQKPYDQDFFIGNFFKDLRDGNIDAFMNRLKAFIANIPYDLKYETEKYFQNIFYLVFTLMGQYTRAEVRSAKGRADMVVGAKDTVYVFEFKIAEGDLDTLVEAALRQIDDKGYLIPYTAGGKKLVKIGAVFNTADRTLGKWKAI